MTQYAILTDLNRCVGCMACMVSCKVINGVPIGSYWNKMLRIGPYKRIGMSLRIRRGFFNKSTASRRAEQSPAPTNYGWLTRSNKERSCHALDAA